MRTGDERAARRALETAFRGDPYDAVTYNLLGLLDTLDGFETIRDGDLVIRLHPDEAGVMREYVPALAREALAKLLEALELHADRADPDRGVPAPRRLRGAHARACPGMIGALGACFGRVVTMDSPQGAAAGRVQLGRHAVARAGPRDHAAAVEPARAALAHRGHLGVGGDAGAARMGPRDGSHLRRRDGAQAGDAAARSQLRVQQSRD